MGMFRWLKDGKTWIYERCTISVEGDDVFFRVRHFAAPKLAARKEKDGALTLKLVGQNAEQVIFQSDKLDMPKVQIIKKTADGVTIRTQGLKMQNAKCKMQNESWRMDAPVLPFVAD